MAPNQVQQLFERFEHLNPAPQTELHWSSHFELLVAVVLSAQSTDKAVNQVTSVLFAHANTPSQMLALGEAELMRLIGSLGLFRSKARHLMALSQLLIERHGGEVPSERSQLEQLPGVGRKTAGVVLNCAFGRSEIPVDTHVGRVARRLGLSASDKAETVESDLMAQVPPQFLSRAHHWLILHGRYVCQARRPQCHSCCARDLCPSAA